MEWFDGKPAGWVHIVDNGYQAVIRNHGSQYFSASIYGSLENAKQAAKEWQYEESTRLGLTKNMIRLVEPDNGDDPYLEVKMQHNDLVMKCDVEHINLVEDSVWTAYRATGKKVWYARRRASVKRNQEYIMFHNLICPQYTQVDHINRDGLDNRTKNLREGAEINPKNKGMHKNNTTGIKGVYFDISKEAWTAQIGGKNKQKKAFRVKMYGADEALRLATEQRTRWERELEYDLS